MTPEEFREYLAEENRKAEPFIPLKNCFACGKPIEDEFVALTAFDPPRLYHPACCPDG